MPLTAIQTVANKTLILNGTINRFLPVVGSSGTGTYTYVISPPISSGLVYSSNGYVSGTATSITTSVSYTVTVTDANSNTAFNTFSLSTVWGKLTPILNTPYKTLIIDRNILPFKPLDAQGGTGTLTYSISPSLPSGVTFNADGYISGVPTAISNTASYTISVSDTQFSSRFKPFSLNVINSSSYSVNAGDLITVDGYNVIQSAVNNIIGIGSEGYGISSFSGNSVTSKNTIKYSNWYGLVRDVGLINVHIDNVFNTQLGSIGTGTLISSTITNVLSNTISYIDANKYLCNPSQYYRDPITGGDIEFGDGTPNSTSTRTTVWGFGTETEITHTSRTRWFTGLLANYFFNQGAYFIWTPEFTGTTTNDIDLEWTNFLTYVKHTGGYEYRREEYVNYISTLTSWTSGTLQISLLATKSTIPDSQGEIGNVIDFTIKYRNTDNPDIVIVPTNAYWNWII